MLEEITDAIKVSAFSPERTRAKSPTEAEAPVELSFKSASVISTYQFPEAVTLPFPFSVVDHSAKLAPTTATAVTTEPIMTPRFFVFVILFSPLRLKSIWSAY